MREETGHQEKSKGRRLGISRMADDTLGLFADDKEVVDGYAAVSISVVGDNLRNSLAADNVHGIRVFNCLVTFTDEGIGWVPVLVHV